MHEFDVTVVIPTRDAVRHLERCLASIAAQQGDQRVEVVVVDQLSMDGTQEAAARSGAVVLETPRGATYTPPTKSRNLGAAKARGEFLLHLDADMTLASDALGRAIASCNSDGHVALTLEEVDVAEGFWAESKALERSAYHGTRIEGARFVRSDVFRYLGGYDESLGSGEDWDVHARYASRGTIGRLKEAVFHHLGAVSFADQVTKKFRYGRSTAAFVAKYDSQFFATEMLKAYARSWRRFARDPWHAVGFVSLRLAETVAVAAGAGLEAAERRRARQRRT